MLRPIINTDVKMPNKVLEALSLFEAYALGGKGSYSESEVKEFIRKEYDLDTADLFKSEYLYSFS